MVGLLIAVGWVHWGFTQHPIAILDTPRPSVSLNEYLHADYEQIPFTLSHGLIHLRAVRNGQAGVYLLDTGAPGLVINQKPAEGATLAGLSCAGSISVGQTRVDQFSWAERQLQAVEAYALDLSHLEAYAGHQIAGLIGYTLFADRTLLIDFQRQLLTLLDPRRVRLDQWGKPRLRLPLQMEGHLPIVEIELGGRTLRFGLDTGAEANLLDSSAAAFIEQACLTALEPEEVQGLDQSVQRVESVIWHDFPLAGQTFSGKFLLTDLSHLGAAGEGPIDGLLGYAFLSRFKVAINYPESYLLLW